MEKKILVIDDIKKNIQLLGSILGSEGYAVSYATNGAKALAMTDSESFDLILLDVMMPEMDGFEVCRRLKEKRNTEDIPILFLTAKSEEEDIVVGLELGAVDYLTKPFNSAELVARVKTHMSLREAHETIVRKNIQLEEKTAQLEALLEKNRRALSEIKVLRGFLPICAKCKKIRNDEGYWTQIESYIRDHSEAQFTHSMCQDCVEELYPFMKDSK